MLELFLGLPRLVLGKADTRLSAEASAMYRVDLEPATFMWSTNGSGPGREPYKLSKMSPFLKYQLLTNFRLKMMSLLSFDQV